LKKTGREPEEDVDQDCPGKNRDSKIKPAGRKMKLRRGFLETTIATGHGDSVAGKNLRGEG